MKKIPECQKHGAGYELKLTRQIIFLAHEVPNKRGDVGDLGRAAFTMTLLSAKTTAEKIKTFSPNIATRQKEKRKKNIISTKKIGRESLLLAPHPQNYTLLVGPALNFNT